MPASPLKWIDRTGVTHRLRKSLDLSTAERGQLNVMRQQLQLSLLIIDLGYRAPAIEQAQPNMIRMMLRMLLPNLAEEEITTFDSTTGNDILTQWWAITDALS